MTNMEIMANPINYKSMFWPAITAILTLIVGILITYFIQGLDIRAFVIFIPICVFLFIILGCIWECIRRPKTVVIADSGIIMKMRYSQGTEMVKWHEIEYLSFNLTYDINTYYGRDGYLDYGNKSRTMYRPIIIAIRERYREIFGKYPPIRQGFH